MALVDLVGPALDAITDGAFSGALAMIQPQGRSIGTIFPDVVIEEGHRDESVITQEPVEGGSVVSDHVIDRPPVVEIRGGFSNSSAGYVGYVQEQYQELLALKASKRPFRLSTGKRLYRNMLINGLAVITDPHSEYTLMFVAQCQFLNIVQNKTSGTGTGTTAPASSQSDQANPASTAGVTNSGTVEARSIDATSFAGAYGPGSSLNPGTGASVGSIGDTSIGAVGSGLSGLSAPPIGAADVGEATFTDPSTGTVLGTTPASPGYNPFATGAFGGT